MEDFREVRVIASKIAKFSRDEFCLINKKIQHLHTSAIWICAFAGSESATVPHADGFFDGWNFGGQLSR